MAEKIKGILQNKMVAAIACIVFGIALMMLQSSALDFIVRVLGAVMLACGVAYILVYIFGSMKTPLQVVSGVIAILFGLLFLTTPQLIVDFLPLVIGLILIVDACGSLVATAGLAAGTAGIVSGPFIMSIIVLVLGILIVVHPGALADIVMFLMGAGLLTTGIFDLYLAWTHRNDVVDV